MQFFINRFDTKMILLVATLLIIIVSVFLILFFSANKSVRLFCKLLRELVFLHVKHYRSYKEYLLLDVYNLITFIIALICISRLNTDLAELSQLLLIILTYFTVIFNYFLLQHLREVIMYYKILIPLIIVLFFIVHSIVYTYLTGVTDSILLLQSLSLVTTMLYTRGIVSKFVFPIGDGFTEHIRLISIILFMILKYWLGIAGIKGLLITLLFPVITTLLYPFYLLPMIFINKEIFFKTTEKSSIKHEDTILSCIIFYYHTILYSCYKKWRELENNLFSYLVFNSFFIILLLTIFTPLMTQLYIIFILQMNMVASFLLQTPGYLELVELNTKMSGLAMMRTPGMVIAESIARKSEAAAAMASALPPVPPTMSPPVSPTAVSHSMIPVETNTAGAIKEGVEAGDKGPFWTWDRIFAGAGAASAAGALAKSFYDDEKNRKKELEERRKELEERRKEVEQREKENNSLEYNNLKQQVKLQKIQREQLKNKEDLKNAEYYRASNTENLKDKNLDLLAKENLCKFRINQNDKIIKSNKEIINEKKSEFNFKIKQDAVDSNNNLDSGS